MDIYIKPKKKVSLAELDFIMVGDVADVVAAKDVVPKVKKLKLVEIAKGGESKKNYVVSVTDIIEAIRIPYPSASINNVGEMDTLVQYAAKKSRDIPWLKWLKVALVAIVLLFGSATAIMSFHTDGQIPKIFERFYTMFYGQEKTDPPIIAIPYAIGLMVGIIVFYNHFCGKKLTDDPTPIEVEMEKYDNDTTTALVDMLTPGDAPIRHGHKPGDGK
ncbi:MAG: stage V sporulation protein AA [Defluviitaleaceae bacterium]|nr:stage V sporulation protein AA [Defluviitaleaceae bacterium]